MTFPGTMPNLSCLFAVKLDRSLRFIYNKIMNKHQKSVPSNAKIIKSSIENAGERFWRISDFENIPFTTIAQTLSRLTRMGFLKRVGKGLYYRPRMTAFGESKPNTSQLRSLPIYGKGIFPAGATAANLLGFSTQNPARIELATNGSSLPRSLMGQNTIIHTRRPESWRDLSTEDGAILDFIRQRGKTSELSPKATVEKLIQHFLKFENFESLLEVAAYEPPRVRAILGAIGQQLGYTETKLSILRKNLNPLSRFDFGNFYTLNYAKQWQAKIEKNHETL